MNIINLGKKRDSHTGIPVNPNKKDNSFSYPSFSIDGINLPLESDDVGTTVKAQVMLKVNKAGAEIDEYGDNKKKYRASFSVMSICFEPKSLDEMEKQEYERMTKRKK